MIEFKNISFGYKNEKNIFDNFSFLVREQERWGILGFNGAGKSTLIKMMLGIIKPQVGEILIENNDIWTISVSFGVKKPPCGGIFLSFQVMKC